MAKQEKEKNNKKHFWRDFKAELKKVIWPTKKQLANNTMVVIAMVLITTVVVLILDLAFEALNTYGINRVKQVVKDSISTTTDENDNNSEEQENQDEQNNEETDSNTTDENNPTNTSSEGNNETPNQ